MFCYTLKCSYRYVTGYLPGRDLVFKKNDKHTFDSLFLNRIIKIEDVLFYKNSEMNEWFPDNGNCCGARSIPETTIFILLHGLKLFIVGFF